MQWLFSSEVVQDTVMVCGHSLWFKSYFSEFLPRDFKVKIPCLNVNMCCELKLLKQHVASKKKLKNGACVTFTVECYNTTQGPVGHSDMAIHVSQWLRRVDTGVPHRS